MMQRPVGLQIYRWFNIFKGGWGCEHQALRFVSQTGKALLGTGSIGARLNFSYTHKLIYNFIDITNPLTVVWEYNSLPAGT